MTFAPYQPVYGCGNDGPGAANMLYWLDKESPWASVGTNFGVCNCRGTGSGSTSQHARCRAWDFGLPLVNGRANPIGDKIVQALIPVAGRLGLTELIWNRRRYSAKAPGGAAYTGVSPHTDHIHGSHTLAATQSLNVPTVRMVMSGATAPAIDWAAVRRLSAGLLLPKMQGVRTRIPTDNNWSEDIKIVQQAVNIIHKANIAVDGVWGTATFLHVAGFQNECKALGLKIEDPAGVVGPTTKWWLCVQLINIRDGK